MEEITLRVGELTNRSESGRGIVRIDSKNMNSLSVREGDIIELQGQSRTGVIVVRAYPQDVGLNIIRMDGITRRNIGVGVGENVKIRKAKVKEARKVVLAPAQKGVNIMMDPNLLKRNLLLRPLMKGDVLSPFPIVKTHDPYEDFLESFGIEGFSFTPIPGEMKFAAQPPP